MIAYRTSAALLLMGLAAFVWLAPSDDGGASTIAQQASTGAPVAARSRAGAWSISAMLVPRRTSRC